jgi:hypothetical protein
MISYSIPMPDFVTLRIHDLLGREIKTLVKEFQPAGLYHVRFNANDLPSGVYLYKLWIGQKVMKTNKMILMR